MKNYSGYTLVDLVSLLFFCFYNSYCVQCHHHIPGGPPESTPNFQRTLFSILSGALTGLVSALLCACLLRFFFRYMKKTPILKGPVIFSPQISPKTLQSALTNDTRLLGNYCITVLDNGLTVAVKKLEPIEAFSRESQRKSVKRRIQKELEILAGLRHRHLMSLRAYIGESDRFCLVYDYVATGSLEDAMRKVRESQIQLGWGSRLRIAVGIIKGLQYLHFATILHHNLKPSNVMLDADFEPRIADCGLAKLIPTSDRSSSGYSAPECCSNLSFYTEKSDVFSFGVILGVLLTGREPMDPLMAGDMGKWLRQLLETGDAREALDKSLLGEEMEEDEMLMAVRIAAVCQSDTPADRPSSDELVPMLTQLHSF